MPPNRCANKAVKEEFCQKVDQLLEIFLKTYGDLLVCNHCDSLWGKQIDATAISQNETIYVLKEVLNLRFHLAQRKNSTGKCNEIIVVN